MSELTDLLKASDQEDYRKKLALMMMQTGMETSPVQHWTQGLARMANGWLGGQELGDLRAEAEKEKRDQKNSALIQAGDKPMSDEPKPPTWGKQLGDGLRGIFGGGAQPAPAVAAPAKDTYSLTATIPDTTSPRGFRNNNPGNIEASPWTRGQPGFAGVEPKGRFAQFDSMESGVNAMGSLIGNYGQRGINTISGVIGRWAPSADGNNVAAYASAVARDMGVAPNAPLNLGDPATQRGLAMAMAKYENGRALPATASQPPQASAPPVAPPQQPAAAPPGVNLAGMTSPQPMASTPPPQMPQQAALPPAQPPVSQMPPAAPPAPNPQMAALQPPQGVGGPQAQPPSVPQRATPQMTPEQMQRHRMLVMLGDKVSMAEAANMRHQIMAPKEQYDPIYDASGNEVSQRNRLTNEKKPVPQDIDAKRKIDEINRNPGNFGFKSADDPAALEAKRNIISGMTNSVTVNNAVNSYVEGLQKQTIGNRAKAMAGADSIPLIHEARAALDSGAITGQAVPIQMLFQKVGSVFGLPADAASNTEVFRSAIGQAVLGHIKDLGANPSNTDLAFMKEIQGGQVTLEEKSLRRILDINEKYARKAIRDSNKDASRLLEANPNEYRAVAPIMKVDEPEEYKTPQNYPKQGDQGPYGQPTPAPPPAPLSIQQLQEEKARRARARDQQL